MSLMTNHFKWFYRLCPFERNLFTKYLNTKWFISLSLNEENVSLAFTKSVSEFIATHFLLKSNKNLTYCIYMK